MRLTCDGRVDHDRGDEGGRIAIEREEIGEEDGRRRRGRGIEERREYLEGIQMTSCSYAIA